MPALAPLTRPSAPRHSIECTLVDPLGLSPNFSIQYSIQWVADRPTGVAFRLNQPGSRGDSQGTSEVRERSSSSRTSKPTARRVATLSGIDWMSGKALPSWKMSKVYITSYRFDKERNMDYFDFWDPPPPPPKKKKKKKK